MSIWPHIAASASLALALTSLSPPAQAHPPPFYRMPDLSPNSRIGVEVVPTFGEVADEGALVLDAGLFADIALTPWLVLSGRVPMAYVYSDPDPPAPEVTAAALGDIGLGLRFIDSSRRRRGARTRIGVGMWLYVPTASDSGEPGAAAAIARGFTVPDHARYFDTTTLRLDLDGRYETHSVFVQGELGLAYHQFGDDGDLDGRIGLGAGVVFNPHLAALAELTLHADDLDALTPVLDAGLRYHDASLIGGARVYWPLGSAQRSRGIIGIGLDLGVRF